MTDTSLLELSDESSSLALRITEGLEVPGTYDGVQLLASVRSEGFGGENASVWVSRHELVEFAEALLALASTSKGQAQLLSHSPEDLRLVIEPFGSLGDVLASGFVGLTFIGHDGWCRNRVEFSMKLGPDVLEKLARHVRRQVVADDDQGR